MKYVEFIAHSGANWVISTFQTSAFDPKADLGGHQPFGFDQWAQFYERYKVMGIAYCVRFVNSSTQRIVGACFTDETNTDPGPLDAGAMLERDDIQAVIIPKQGTNDGQKNVRYLKGYLPAWKIMRKAKEVYKDDTSTGAVTNTNPSLMGFVKFITCAINGSSSVTCDLEIELTYYTQFFAPIGIGQSGT